MASGASPSGVHRLCFVYRAQEKWVECEKLEEVVSAGSRAFGVDGENMEASVQSDEGTMPLGELKWRDLVDKKIHLGQKVVTTKVDSTPAPDALYESQSATGEKVERLTHVEFFANSLKALKNTGETTIKMIYVYENDDLAHMVFLDHGCGMNKESIVKWSQLGKRDTDHVNKETLNGENKEEPTLPFESHADGELNFFGKGSKAAAFSAGAWVGVVTLASDSDTVYAIRMRKAEAERKEKDKKHWESVLMEWSKSQRDVVLDYCDSMLGGGRALRELLKREICVGPPLQHFSVFVVSELNDQVKKGLGGRDFTRFEAVAEFSSSYFARYLEPSLNMLDYEPHVECEAFLFHDDGTCERKVFVLSDTSYTSREPDLHLERILPDGKITYPIRLDAVRELVRAHESFYDMKNSPTFDFNFQIMENGVPDNSGTIKCRCMLVPRRGGEDLMVWSTDDKKLVPLKTKWDPREKRILCDWKGQKLPDMIVDKLAFLEDLKSTEQPNKEAAVVVLLSFGAVANTDARKQKLGDDFLVRLKGDFPAPRAGDDDSIRTTFSITRPGAPRTTTGAPRTTTRTTLTRDLRAWYEAGMKAYDQYVTVTCDKRGDIIKATKDGVEVSRNDRVIFSRPRRTEEVSEATKGENATTTQKKKNTLTVTSRKAVGKVSRFTFLDGADHSRKDQRDLRVWLRREPTNLFEAQEIGPLSFFAVEASGGKASARTKEIIEDIEARAPKTLKLSIATTHCSNVKEKHPKSITWTAGITTKPMTLEIFDAGKRRLVDWCHNFSTSALKFEPVIKVVCERGAEPYHHIRRWRPSNQFQQRTVFATTSGCSEPTRDTRSYVWPSDWIEEHVLDGGKEGIYNVEVYLYGWSSSEGELKYRDLGVVELTINCVPGPARWVRLLSFSSSPNTAAAAATARTTTRACYFYPGEAVRACYSFLDAKRNAVASRSLSPDQIVKSRPLIFQRSTNEGYLDFVVDTDAEAGDYELHVRKDLRDGDEVTTLAFEIRPPPPAHVGLVLADGTVVSLESDAARIPLAAHIDVENHRLLAFSLQLLDSAMKKTQPPGPRWTATVESADGHLELTTTPTRGRNGQTVKHFDNAGVATFDLDIARVAEHEAADTQPRKRPRRTSPRPRSSVSRPTACALTIKITRDDKEHLPWKDVRLGLCIKPSKRPHFMRLFEDGDSDPCVKGDAMDGPVQTFERLAATERFCLVRFYDEAGMEVAARDDVELLLSFKRPQEEEKDSDECIVLKRDSKSFKLKVPSYGSLRCEVEGVPKEKASAAADEHVEHLRPLLFTFRAAPGDVAELKLQPLGPGSYKVGTPLREHKLALFPVDKFGNRVVYESRSPPALDLEIVTKTATFLGEEPYAVPLAWCSTLHQFTTDAAVLGRERTSVQLQVTGRGVTLASPFPTFTLVLAAGDPYSLEATNAPTARGLCKGLTVAVRDRAGNGAVVGGATLTLNVEEGSLQSALNASTSASIEATYSNGRFLFDDAGFWLWAGLNDRVKASLALTPPDSGITLLTESCADFRVDGPSIPGAIRLQPQVQNCLAGEETTPITFFEVLDESGKLYAPPAPSEVAGQPKSLLRIRTPESIADVTTELSPVERTFRIADKASDDGTLKRAGVYDVTIEVPAELLAILAKGRCPPNYYGSGLQASAQLRVRPGPAARLVLETSSNSRSHVALGAVHSSDLDERPKVVCARLIVRVYDDFGNVVDAPSGDEANLGVTLSDDDDANRNNSNVGVYISDGERAPHSNHISLRRGTERELDRREMSILVRKQEDAAPMEGRKRCTLTFRLENCAGEATATFVVCNLQKLESSIAQGREMQGRERASVAKLRASIRELEHEHATTHAQVTGAMASLRKACGAVSEKIRLEILRGSNSEAAFEEEVELRPEAVLSRVDEQRRHITEAAENSSRRHGSTTQQSFDESIIGQIRDMFYVKDPLYAKLLAWHLGPEMDQLVTESEEAANELGKGHQQARPSWTYDGQEATGQPPPHETTLVDNPEARNLWEQSGACLASDKVAIAGDARANPLLGAVHQSHFGRIIIFPFKRDAFRYRQCFEDKKVPFNYTCLCLDDRSKISSLGVYGGASFHEDPTRSRFRPGPPETEGPDFKALTELKRLIREIRGLHARLQEIAGRKARAQANVDDHEGRIANLEKQIRLAEEQVARERGTTTNNDTTPAASPERRTRSSKRQRTGPRPASPPVSRVTL